jgi:hypothetical protein
MMAATVAFVLAGAECMQWVLIDHGRWTRGVDIIDDTGTRRTIRKVDNKDILMVTDEPVNDDTMGTKVV